ncbi:hypothetical protein FJ948_26175 [Mesorhizobium sp. B2-3-12]|nr:hypothetical protein FJ948_26175 [Mesorhizobium sp. B2-3-12]
MVRARARCIYGVGSSQYNRLAVRADDHPGLPYDIKWGAIGKSLTGGFGTLQPSPNRLFTRRESCLDSTMRRRGYFTDVNLAPGQGRLC